MFILFLFLFDVFDYLQKVDLKLFYKIELFLRIYASCSIDLSQKHIAELYEPISVPISLAHIKYFLFAKL